MYQRDIERLRFASQQRRCGLQNAPRLLHDSSRDQTGTLRSVYLAVTQQNAVRHRDSTSPARHHAIRSCTAETSGSVHMPCCSSTSASSFLFKAGRRSQILPCASDECSRVAGQTRCHILQASISMTTQDGHLNSTVAGSSGELVSSPMVLINDAWEPRLSTPSLFQSLYMESSKVWETTWRARTAYRCIERLI